MNACDDAMGVGAVVGCGLGVCSDGSRGASEKSNRAKATRVESARDGRRAGWVR